jgi:hypothetical protein
MNRDGGHSIKKDLAAVLTWLWEGNSKNKSSAVIHNWADEAASHVIPRL